MNIERVEEVIRNKKKVISIILISISIIGVFFYLKAFFTKGAYFEEVFLKKEVIGDENNYTGKSIDGDIHIIVNKAEEEKGNIKETFKLPNNMIRKYNVKFEGDIYQDRKTQTITNEVGEVIFEGSYREGSIALFDKNGKPLLDDIFRIHVKRSDMEESRFPQNYEASLITITKFAYADNDTIRGNPQYLVIAIILSIVTTIDIKYPLFFFRLKHFLSVQDPEPTELYILIQRIEWVVCPLIIIGCLIAGIS